MIFSRKLTFHGGVHPDDNKSFTASKPIKALTPPNELIFPLSQHIGRSVRTVREGRRFR